MAKKSLASVFASKKMKQESMQTRVSQAGLLGIVNRDKDKRFKRGTTGSSVAL